jgi:hypothetical protein
MRHRKPRISPIELRKQQIYKELDKIREETATKTRRHFKTDQSFEEWKRRRAEKVAELDEELSILLDPGEYEELPFAVVAEELGITADNVRLLVGLRELEPSETGEGSKEDRITRAELEQALEIGADELLRLADQESPEIFEEALPYFHAGDIEVAEKVYQRIKERDSWHGSHAPACELALDLLKGDLHGAMDRVRHMCEMDINYNTAMLPYTGRLLRGMKLQEHIAEALREQILLITEGARRNPYDHYDWWRSKQIGKRQDETQQRAMYIASAVQNALKRYRWVQQFKSYRDRSSRMRDEEFEGLIRDAIYTALQAEATYNESAASKKFVDTMLGMIPRWWAPAELLALLPAKKTEDDDSDTVAIDAEAESEERSGK